MSSGHRHDLRRQQNLTAHSRRKTAVQKSRRHAVAPILTCDGALCTSSFASNGAATTQNDGARATAHVPKPCSHRRQSRHVRVCPACPGFGRTPSGHHRGESRGVTTLARIITLDRASRRRGHGRLTGWVPSQFWVLSSSGWFRGVARVRIFNRYNDLKGVRSVRFG